MLEGAEQWMSGSLSNQSVRRWLCFFQATRMPQMVLFSGSLPIATFVVSGFSPRCMKVPPIWKFFEKSYCQSRPNIVLRCMP